MKYLKHLINISLNAKNILLYTYKWYQNVTIFIEKYLREAYFRYIRRINNLFMQNILPRFKALSKSCLFTSSDIFHHSGQESSSFFEFGGASPLLQDNHTKTVHQYEILYNIKKNHNFCFYNIETINKK